MAGFNFKTIGTNKKRSKQSKQNNRNNRNKNTPMNNKNYNLNKNYNTFKNNTNNINYNKNIINPIIQDSEKTLLKQYWPDFPYEKKTLANILKYQEKLYNDNINWYKFVNNK
jgi:hypothetical protein